MMPDQTLGFTRIELPGKTVSPLVVSKPKSIAFSSTGIIRVEYQECLDYIGAGTVFLTVEQAKQAATLGWTIEPIRTEDFGLVRVTRSHFEGPLVYDALHPSYS